ncbi:hypothetical protein BC629DRAFT_1265684, partial [Irpex lacteus]
TPSKRVCIMQATLASTSSGSFLVSSEPIRSSHHIAAPVLERLPLLDDVDWKKLTHGRKPNEQSHTELVERVQELTAISLCAKNHIQAQHILIEAAQAQLVVQDLYARKLNETLFTKENPPSKDRTKLIFEDGKGRYLTEEGIVATLETMEHNQEMRIEDKKQKRRTRDAERKAKKVAKAVVDAEWKAIKSAHETNIAVWTSKCEQLAEEGLPKSRWPKKPTR